MPSPFPGMNPYFESPDLWEDFQQSLAVQVQAQLTPNLRPRYYAALVPHVTYEEEVIREKSDDTKLDVGVRGRSPLDEPAPATVAVLPPPPIMESIAEEVPVKLWTVEIREAGLGTLVTSIEILSPVNKRAKHEAYVAHQRKRTALMRAGVNLDLLRTGRRWSLPDKELPDKELPDAPYFVFL